MPLRWPAFPPRERERMNCKSFCLHWKAMLLRFPPFVKWVSEAKQREGLGRCSSSSSKEEEEEEEDEILFHLPLHLDGTQHDYVASSFLYHDVDAGLEVCAEMRQRRRWSVLQEKQVEKPWSHSSTTYTQKRKKKASSSFGSERTQMKRATK